VVTKIKVGQQKQADKPIYLLHTGAVECGRFRYEGSCKRKFRSIFNRICLLAHTKPKDGVLDISDYKYWDAMRIYDDHVVAHWCKSVSAVRLEKFASETEIVLMLAEIKSEFKRAVGLRWKREFKKYDPNDENIPREAWQIL
jgi:hypothetical protein